MDERGRFTIDDAGWVSPARRVRSPNADARPPGEGVDLVVVHAISLPPGVFSGDAVEALFTNQLDPAAHPYFATIDQLRVSAHLFVRRDGEAAQFVPLSERAWHAGASTWHSRTRCNDFSIGIELEGDDETPFQAVQYDVLNDLLAAIRRRYPGVPAVGHSDIAPGRKTDPGPAFDWSRVVGGKGD